MLQVLLCDFLCVSCFGCRYVNGGAQRLPCNSGDSVASLYFEGLMLMRSAVGSKYNHKAMVRSKYKITVGM